MRRGFPGDFLQCDVGGIVIGLDVEQASSFARLLVTDEFATVDSGTKRPSQTEEDG